MPIYEYHCMDCQNTFSVFHSMNEEYEGTCDLCKSNNIEKIVSSMGSKINTTKFKTRTGDLVKGHIEDTRSAIKKEKQRLKSKVYKDD
jgi:putative FmdB family regulatory protein